MRTPMRELLIVLRSILDAVSTGYVYFAAKVARDLAQQLSEAAESDATSHDSDIFPPCPV